MTIVDPEPEDTDRNATGQAVHKRLGSCGRGSSPLNRISSIPAGTVVESYDRVGTAS
ncbi:hypothetical protein [Arthrobacter sp. MA-N2]|uniref:hypothetical protein n=1 Tax=Arthrobacter sp. MA-N2 TaxID=1101188 RepID=UPI0012DC0514|nr:hypothetical protein [Arthrobacter sp. MA-N2]